MKRLTAFVAAFAAAASVLGGVVAYRWAAGESRAEQLVAANVAPEPEATTPAAKPAKPVVKFKKCKPPSHREGKVCVVDVVQDVVLPAPAAANPPARTNDGGSDDHQQAGDRDDDDHAEGRSDDDRDGDDRDGDDRDEHDDDDHDDDHDDDRGGDDD